MNRKSLLEALRKQGYKGAADLAAVKSFLTESGQDSENIETPSKDGEVVSVKIDEIWAKTATLALVGEESEPQGDEGDGEEPVNQKSHREPEKKSAVWQKHSTLLRGQQDDEPRKPGAPAIRSERERMVKAYDKRVASRKSIENINDHPVFDSGDEAEAFGAFFRLASAGTASGGSRFYEQKNTDVEILAKSHVEYDQTAGGVLVPQKWSQDVIWLTEQYGTALKLANVVSMSGPIENRPRKTGIQAMQPTAEAGSKGTGDDTFDMVKLVAQEASLIKRCSYQLYQDSAANVADEFARGFAEAGAKRIDDDYFLGDGTSTYNGHVGLVGALPSGAYTTAASPWTSWTTAHIDAALGLLEYVNEDRIRIVSSRQCFYNTANRLATATSQFAPLVGPGRNGSNRTFKDVPWFFAPSCPTVTGATAKSAYVGDFMGGSMIGIRNRLEILFSDQAFWTTGEVAWRGIMRYAVNIHGAGRGETYGPIVCIKNG